MAIDAADYKRQYGLSPIFRQRLASSLAANAVFAYDWEVSANGTAGKYLPFNLLQITNNSLNSPVELYVNGEILPIKYIPAGTILSIDKETLPAFKSVLIKNIGTAAISAGEIEIVAQREAITPTQMAQETHKAIYSKKQPDGWV